MCGIAGKLNFDAAAPIDRERLGAMTAVVAHRGPDADGFYVAPGLGLGHRRLSIIDLSTGDQPLANEDGTVWVVFNGEIYNFMEIRSELERAGHRFRTGTDTEVIVHAYEQWGEEAVHRFRGMFAFALWDEPRRRLLLVRDRLGIKPLYYAVTPTGITFGSEIKSLLEDPDVPKDWSGEALDAYLALLYVPGPQTIYRHIHKLPAGHLLVAEDGRASVRQVLGPDIHRRRRSSSGGRISRAPGRTGHRSGQDPPVERCAAGGVSLGRDRFQHGRGRDGPARPRRAS